MSDKEDKKTTSAIIPIKLYKRSKIYCINNDIHMTDLINMALERYLDKKNKPSETEPLQ